MNDLVLVEVLEGRNDLGEIVLAFHFCKSLPTLDKFVKGVVGADFEQDVDIFVVFKDVLEFDHMVIV